MPKSRPPHPHHHHHHHLHPPHGHPSQRLSPSMLFTSRLVKMLTELNAPEMALHALIDQEIDRPTGLFYSVRDHDIGKDVGVLERVSVLMNALPDHTTSPFTGKRVLVAGEFPPHYLDVISGFATSVQQLHQPEPHGGGAPLHLSHVGLARIEWIKSFDLIKLEEVDIVIGHASRLQNCLFGGALLAVTIQVYPSLPLFLLIENEPLPHADTCLGENVVFSPMWA
jgi:hypothetical protein